MIAAAAWGPGAAYTESAYGTSLYDALPNPVEGAFYGLAISKHRRGLQSGGILGYSTFATGYDPDRHGMGRRVSLGRAALKTVGWAARGLEHTELGASTWGKRWLPGIAQIERLGLASVLTSVDANKVISARGQQRYRSSTAAALRSERHMLNASRRYGGWDPTTDELRHAARQQMGAKELRKTLKNIDPDMIEARTVQAVWGKNKALKTMLGMLGGFGFDEKGNLKGTAEIINGRAYFQGAKGTGGAVWATGAGKALGMAARFSVGLEIANWAVNKGIDQVGMGYQSAVRRVNLMQSRLAYGSNTMSAGYFGQAAATERQRAMMELSASGLHPRNQLMGNEAAAYHR